MILDCTAGLKSIYRVNAETFSTLPNTLIIFTDKRAGPVTTPSPTRFAVRHIHPDTMADITALPFKTHTFNMIIFDPPHQTLSLDSWHRWKYGSWTRTEHHAMLQLANTEFHRILKPTGTLMCKCQDYQARHLTYPKYFSNFSLLLVVPLETKKTGRRWRTYWLVFVAK